MKKYGSNTSIAISPRLFPALLQLFFTTYPFYADRDSRRAIQRCLRTIFSCGAPPQALAEFIKALDLETTKQGLAAANAFVLVEWCGVLIQEMAGTGLWEKWGVQMIECSSRALELCLGESSKHNVKHSALVVTRRALRKAFSPGESQGTIIESVVRKLSAKGTQLTARNAIMLGVVAGVCARKTQAKENLVQLKSEYYAFYVREIIGSRTQIPRHIASALGDFFVDFTTKDDVEKEIVPALEKALLRAPEIVLNDLVTPLFQSLPESIDLSSVLQGKLLKPLLSNLKSSNATIRRGALSAFKAAVVKCHDLGVVSKIGEEILAPLKSGKLSSADQRALYAEMLSALPVSEDLLAKIGPAIAATASKEANEAALYSETSTLLYYLTNGPTTGKELDKQIIDAFVKGISDKKIPTKKLWTIRLGELFWAIQDDSIVKSQLSKLAEAVIPALMDIWQETATNSMQAGQSGLVVAAYVFTAISESKLALTTSPKIEMALKKAQIHQQALLIEPKPSFLLNPRIFTKLTTDDDTRWLVRALVSVSQRLSSIEPDSAIAVAWSQAMIFCICSATITSDLRREASRALSLMYVKNAALIYKVIIAGLWRWRDAVELGEKESAAAAAKSETNELHMVVKAICLSPAEITELGGSIDSTVKKEQMISLLVLSRPRLLPRVTWIDTCLRVGVDPGDLARTSGDVLMQQILHRTSFDVNVCIPSIVP